MMNIDSLDNCWTPYCHAPPLISERIMLDFDTLRTPPSHGDVLVEPAMDRLAGLVEQNRELIASYIFSLAGVPIGDLRKMVRGALCPDCRGPIIVTGHQPEFIHAGVWAKHVVASDLAKRMDAAAVNLIVDSDAPNDATLDVPGVAGDHAVWRAVRYGQLLRGGVFEHIAAIGDEACGAFEDDVRRQMGGLYDASCMPEYFDALKQAVEPRDWVDQMVHARKVVEQSFGVEMIEHRISRVFAGPLLAEMMLNAERFAECYNGALADYRRRYGVRSANRPIPDLICDGGRCEVPLWAVRDEKPRQRLFVESRGDTVTVYADSDMIGEVSRDDLLDWERAEAALCRAGACVFRPRALSLTLWARLLLGDLFIHGIGGAKYDRITDEIIRRYFGVEPPAMACVSASLMLDLPQKDVSPESLVEAIRLARDVRYNPQNYVGDVDEAKAEEAKMLVDERRSVLAEADDLKQNDRRNHRQRRAVYLRICAVNEKLSRLASPSPEEADAGVRRLREAMDERLAARRRDYFFAMNPRATLEKLAHALAQPDAFRL